MAVQHPTNILSLPYTSNRHASSCDVRQQRQPITKQMARPHAQLSSSTLQRRTRISLLSSFSRQNISIKTSTNIYGRTRYKYPKFSNLGGYSQKFLWAQNTPSFAFSCLGYDPNTSYPKNRETKVCFGHIFMPSSGFTKGLTTASKVH